ncbi:MAG: von Willebrand factor type A domain-containing protein [Bacteroidia bacterium]|nr:von Willebrand factor type A domain-containing protein [Bacteroidia bacterium]
MKKTLILGTAFLLLLSSCYEDGYFHAEELSNLNNDAPGNEQYNEYKENEFLSVVDSPFSTFSIDADGGSYTNTRRFINEVSLPPKSAVRIEEFINYFNFDYENPNSGHPIGLNGEISACPWNDKHKLIRIGIKGKEIPKDELPAANFVLLVDKSGSMGSDDKLPLFRDAISEFVDQLDSEDKISIVTYAGSAGVALEPTSGDKKNKINRAIKGLVSGGSTNGSGGIKKAYDLAEENFIEGGNNRVILVTDGDFNVGISDQDKLIELIEEMRDKKIFLTVIGVGSGNLQEGTMEQLANNGNGNFEYLDQPSQGTKLFVHEYQKFFTVAKDVKVQIEFNPSVVSKYRLIGYENRTLAQEDFEDDSKDAGEIGAGQTITALYEIELTEGNNWETQSAIEIDFRYKMPNEDTSIPLSLAVFEKGTSFDNSSENMRFAASLAGFGMLLIESDYKGTCTFEKVASWARNARSFDPFGFRNEYLDILDDASKL